jgi:hypothetical protein
MPVPGGEITGSQIWTEPATTEEELVQDPLPEVKEDEVTKDCD